MMYEWNLFSLTTYNMFCRVQAATMRAFWPSPEYASTSCEQSTQIRVNFCDVKSDPTTNESLDHFIVLSLAIRGIDGENNMSLSVAIYPGLGSICANIWPLAK